MFTDFSGGDLQLASVSRADGLREQVTDALRAALIAGRMRPGTLYSAPVLAEMLGVSPTPVREAMQDLAKEGMVEVVRNRGFRVTAVSERELDELVAVRLLTEVPTMGEVAEAYNASMDGEFARLRQIARDLETAAESNDLVSYMQLDTEFHTSFLALHGNTMLATLVRNMRSRSRLYGLEALARTGRLIASTREHMQMIDLAATKNRKALEALTRVHIGHTRSIWASGGANR
ncbi:GntR family transcriptional regulator [Streptomyces sp. NPDC090442]|uniref:GntR family transcriptional regulator n=1 Tax=Streptomyces sp. NPDC090442 TaxID=3365962 RepID=UPI003830ADE2